MLSDLYQSAILGFSTLATDCELTLVIVLLQR
jgi:hypothetical protein